MGIFSKKSTAGYNGWSNKQTWIVNAWINNHEECYEVLRAAYRLEGDSQAAAWLEREVRAHMPSEEVCQGIFIDLLVDSCNRVNWLEIIEANRE